MSGLAPTYRAMLAAIPDEWGRSNGSVKMTSKGVTKLRQLGLIEFRQIIDPNHTDTRFRPGLIGQVRLTDAGRVLLGYSAPSPIGEEKPEAKNINQGDDK